MRIWPEFLGFCRIKKDFIYYYLQKKNNITHNPFCIERNKMLLLINVFFFFYY